MDQRVKIAWAKLDVAECDLHTALNVSYPVGTAIGWKSIHNNVEIHGVVTKPIQNGKIKVRNEKTDSEYWILVSKIIRE